MVYFVNGGAIHFLNCVKNKYSHSTSRLMALDLVLWCSMFISMYSMIQAFVTSGDPAPEVWAHERIKKEETLAFTVSDVNIKRAAYQFGMFIEEKYRFKVRIISDIMLVLRFFDVSLTHTDIHTHTHTPSLRMYFCTCICLYV